jgi:hypothetical protein
MKPVLDMETKPLEHSNFIDLTIWSSDKNVNEAVSVIYDKICVHLGSSINNKNRSIYIRNLKVALLNLYVNYVKDPKLYIVFSRNRNHNWYKLSFRYNKNKVTYVITKVFDALVSSGLIDDYKKGFFNRTTNSGRSSRIKANKDLIDILNDFNFKKISIFRNLELIELRAAKRTRVKNGKRIKEKKGELLNYKDTDDISKMRNNLLKINTLLQNQSINLPQNIKEEMCNNKNLTVNPSKDKLRRVFSNSSFNDGGRFYGHWVESLPKKYRKHLIINGQPVCEIDYNEFHIRLLYDHMGLKPPNSKDLYRVLGYLPTKRKLLKKVLNAHICAKSNIQALKGVLKDIKDDDDLKNITYDEIKVFSKLLFKKHGKVITYLNSGYGTKLQRLDSDLTESIIFNLLNKGIPVIPIHDSFIVPKYEQKHLEAAMKEEYFKRFDSYPQYKNEY